MMKKKSRWKSRWLGSAGAQSAGSSTDLDDFDRIKWKEEEEAATILNSILRRRQWRRSAHNRIGQLDDSLVMATAAASSPTTTSISMRRDSLIIDVNKSRKFFFFSLERKRWTRSRKTSQLVAARGGLKRRGSVQWHNNEPNGRPCVAFFPRTEGLLLLLLLETTSVCWARRLRRYRYIVAQQQKQTRIYGSSFQTRKSPDSPFSKKKKMPSPCPGQQHFDHQLMTSQKKRVIRLFMCGTNKNWLARTVR